MEKDFTKRMEPSKEAELKERIKKAIAEDRVEFAPAAGCGQYGKEVDLILAAIARRMLPEDPQKWLECCFVSDESSFHDFPFDNKELAELGRELGIPLKQKTLIVDAAMMLKAKKNAGVAE